MENKIIYVRPETEVLELEMEGMIAASSTYSVDEEDTYDGPAFSKPRRFWD